MHPVLPGLVPGLVPLPAVAPRLAAGAPAKAPGMLSFATQPVQPSSGPILTLPRLEVPVGGSVS